TGLPLARSVAQGAPAELRCAPYLRELGRDTVADARRRTRREPPGEVGTFVKLDQRDRVGDVGLQLGLEGPVVGHLAPDRAARRNLGPGGRAGQALGAAGQRRPAQLAARVAALDDEPPLARRRPERSGQRVLRGGQGPGFAIHAPTSWFVDR